MASGVLCAIPQAHDEPFEQQRPRARRIEPAAFGVEQLHRIEFANRRAVRALHVIGENLQLGLAVRGCAAVEQHGLDRLLGIGLLRSAGHFDLAEIGAGRLAAEYRAHNLPRAAAFAEMPDVRDDFVGRDAGADIRAEQFEIRAFCASSLRVRCGRKPAQY